MDKLHQTGTVISVSLAAGNFLVVTQVQAKKLDGVLRSLELPGIPGRCWDELEGIAKVQHHEVQRILLARMQEEGYWVSLNFKLTHYRRRGSPAAGGVTGWPGFHVTSTAEPSAAKTMKWFLLGPLQVPHAYR